MSNNRKLIFFDIDGTLVTEGENQYVPESTYETLKKLRNNGHICIINTGRPYASLNDVIMSIEVDGYVCGCGTYIRLGDNILMSHHISEAICDEVLRELEKCRLEWLLEGEKMLYFSDGEYSSRLKSDIRAIKEKLPDNITCLDMSESHSVCFDKFCFAYNDNSDKDGFISHFESEFTFIDRGNRFFETVPKGYSKAGGMKYLETYFGINNSDTFAVGDSTNDIPMLSYAGTGILMGGADKSLAEYADYITTDIEDYGIKNAFIHFGLI